MAPIETDEKQPSIESLETLSNDLVRLVNGLWVEFYSPSALAYSKGSPSFPNRDCLTQLLYLVRQIAKRTGRKKVQGRFTWGAFEHVQKHFSGTKLLRCLQILVSNYARLPAEPAWRLSHECPNLQPSGTHPWKEIALVIDHVRRCALDLELNGIDQATALGILRPYSSAAFRSAEQFASFSDPATSARPSQVTRFRFWALFVDLIAQQADWEMRFGRHRHVARWIADLYNDTFAHAIRQHLRDPYVPRKAIAAAFDAAQKRLRTRKWRARREDPEKSASKQ